MTLAVAFRQAARAELDEAADHYDGCGCGCGCGRDSGPSL